MIKNGVFGASFLICMASSFFVGCSGQKDEHVVSNASSGGVAQTKAGVFTPVPTEYKVLDLRMGMSKKELLGKGFDCKDLKHSGFCETYTHPEGNPKYRSINKNGTINGILAYLDQNEQVYKIELTSTHTRVDTDIQQYKTTLKQLIENNPNIEQKLDTYKSAYFNGAFFVSLSIADKAREAAYNAQKVKQSSSDANDIKNFK